MANPHRSPLVVALSAAHATSETWRAPMAPFDPETGTGWPALAQALQQLRSALGLTVTDRMVPITVVLMPSLCELRVVSLPPLRDEEARLVLTRNAARYFVSARGAQVVGCAPAPSDGPSGDQSRIAAAASSRLVHAVHEAAVEAGFRVHALVPAEVAWCTIAAAPTSADRGATAGGGAQVATLLLDGAHSHLLFHTGTELTGVRRFRDATLDAQPIVQALREQGTAVLLAGDADARRDVARLLAAEGIPLRTARGPAAEQLASVERLACVAVAEHDAPLAPVLETDSVREARDSGARRLAVRLVAAALLCLLGAGALQLWDVRRELAAVRAERELLRPQLGSTLVGRTTVEATLRQLAELAAARENAPAWSPVLAGLTEQLPYDAYLTGFRGRADTVGIDGLAQSASRVFGAVSNVPLLDSVTASAPVRRETTPEGEALERFQFTARLARETP